MAIKPSAENYLTIKGMFDFTAKYHETLIKDSYNLCIHVPNDFPKNIPIVKELDGKIDENDNDNDSRPVMLI